MEVNKPFSCPLNDCDMTFVNEDHLTVHKKKHELCLQLTPTTARNPFIDQTPTPTRFLNALESEIFDNPFEVTFRRANSQNGGSNSFAIPESSSLISSLPDSEVLNTPSITLPVEPQTPLAIRRKNLDKTSSRNNSQNGTFQESNDLLPFASNDNLPFASNNKEISRVAELQKSEIIPAIVTTAGDDASVVIEGGIQKQSAIRTSVVHTPVITSASAIKASTIGVPAAVVVAHTTCEDNATVSLTTQPTSAPQQGSQAKVQEPTQAVVQSVSVTPMVQLLIRLPDGQTMPVQFPIMASTSKAVQQSVANIVPQLSQTTSLTKMKLKESLSSGQKSGNRRKVPISKMYKQEIRVLPAQECLEDFGFGMSPPSSPNHMSGLDGHRDMDGDPDEKRKKSLERNRAAATRARQKRKQWIQALEKKADELAHTNVNLQHEVTMLRNEVTHLKTMLLAHKDCPVTLQQKASGYAHQIQKDPLTTVHIITTTQENIRNATGEEDMIIPLNVELMEMEEVNSSQSGSSDLSISSVTSETSCRER